jgi:hypothetical protein
LLRTDHRPPGAGCQGRLLFIALFVLAAIGVAYLLLKFAGLA